MIRIILLLLTLLECLVSVPITYPSTDSTRLMQDRLYPYLPDSRFPIRPETNIFVGDLTTEEISAFYRAIGKASKVLSHTYNLFKSQIPVYTAHPDRWEDIFRRVLRRDTNVINSPEDVLESIRIAKDVDTVIIDVQREFIRPAFKIFTEYQLDRSATLQGSNLLLPEVLLWSYIGALFDLQDGNPELKRVAYDIVTNTVYYSFKSLQAADGYMMDYETSTRRPNPLATYNMMPTP